MRTKNQKQPADKSYRLADASEQVRNVDIGTVSAGRHGTRYFGNSVGMFIVAAIGGHVDVLEKLQETGEVDINRPTKNLFTPLMAASGRGREDVVKYLLGLNGIGITLRDAIGANAVHHAAWHGHLDVVKILLETGEFDVNDQGP